MWIVLFLIKRYPFFLKMLIHFIQDKSLKDSSKSYLKYSWKIFAINSIDMKVSNLVKLMNRFFLIFIVKSQRCLLSFNYFLIFFINIKRVREAKFRETLGIFNFKMLHFQII
jgi:hypothetical protein